MAWGKDSIQLDNGTFSLDSKRLFRLDKSQYGAECHFQAGGSFLTFAERILKIFIFEAWK